MVLSLITMTAMNENSELSTVFSAATSILTTLYSQVQDEESSQQFFAPPVIVPQAEPNTSSKVPGRNQVCFFGS